MKNAKRFLSLALVCALLVTAFVTGRPVVKAESVAMGTSGLYYELVDGTLTISGEGVMPNYDTYGSKKSPWYNSRNSIKSIVMETGVTSIGNYAFYECSNLTNVTVPESVTSIGNAVFLRCSNLISVTVPEGVTSIGYSAFNGCSSLTSIEIPGSVTSIESSVFSGCSSLTSIEIPEGVTSIGYGAFLNCSKLTSIEIPESVTSIGSSAFSGCNSLTSIDVAENNANYASKDGIVFDKSETTLLLYPAGKITDGSCTIPEGVTSIGEGVFYGYSNLTNVTIPESVTSIGKNAFRDCTNLTNIVIPESITVIEYGTFQSTGLQSVSLPSTLTSIGDYAFSNCSSLVSLDIPDSVTKLGTYAFYECSGLTSLKLPNNEVEFIDSYGYSAGYTFAYCSSLKEVEIPEKWTTMCDSIFTECENLEKVTLHDGLEIIPAQAFRYCDKLKSINIPDTVTSIGGGAFYNCSKLTGSIVIPDAVTSIGYGAFGNCITLKSVYLRNNDELSIDSYAFEECASLEEIVLPAGLTSIKDNAFFNCFSLRYVYDNTPTHIAKFDGIYGSVAYNASAIIRPDTVQSGDFCFDYNTEKQEWQLTGYTGGQHSNIILPDHFYDKDGKKIESYSLGDYAFNKVMGVSIESVIIPENVTRVGDYAFCKSNVISIVVLGKETTISDTARVGYDVLGYKDSPAQSFADDNGKSFTALDDFSNTLTFYANGGTYSDGTTEYKRTSENGIFNYDISDIQPIRVGYVLAGWSMGAPDTYIDFADTCCPYSADKTLYTEFYAVWREELALDDVTPYDGTLSGLAYDSVKNGVNNGSSLTFAYESAKWTNDEKTEAELRTDFSFGTRKSADIMFVLDISSSMAGPFYNELIRKVKEVTNNLLTKEGYDNRVAIVPFAITQEESMDFTSDLTQVHDFVDKMGMIDGSITDIASGLKGAYDIIKEREDDSREAFVVLLTDAYVYEQNAGYDVADAIKGELGCEIAGLLFGDALSSKQIMTKVSSKGAMYSSTDLQQFNDYMNLAITSAYDVYELTSIINSENFEVDTTKEITVTDATGATIEGAASLADDGVTLVLNTKVLNPCENYTVSVPLKLKAIGGTNTTAGYNVPVARKADATYPTGKIDVLAKDAQVTAGMEDKVVNTIETPILTRTTGTEPYTVNYYDGTTLLQEETNVQGKDGKYTLTSAPLTNPTDNTKVKNAIPVKNGYIFAGWYTSTDNATSRTTAGAYKANFTLAEFADADHNVNLYAGWVAEGKFDKKADKDTNKYAEGKDLTGFALKGVQVRAKDLLDNGVAGANKNTEFDGLRFVTMYSLQMLKDLEAVNVEPKDVGYGYALGVEDKVGDVADFVLPEPEEATAPIKKVECTQDGDNNHKYFENAYLLSTVVVKYDKPYSEETVDTYAEKNVMARAYVEYIDANGFDRVAYDDYEGTDVAGACMTSLKAAVEATTAAMLPQQQ